MKQEDFDNITAQGGEPSNEWIDKLMEDVDNGKELSMREAEKALSSKYLFNECRVRFDKDGKKINYKCWA